MSISSCNSFCSCAYSPGKERDRSGAGRDVVESHGGERPRAVPAGAGGIAGGKPPHSVARAARLAVAILASSLLANSLVANSLVAIPLAIAFVSPAVAQAVPKSLEQGGTEAA